MEDMCYKWPLGLKVFKRRMIQVFSRLICNYLFYDYLTVCLKLCNFRLILDHSVMNMLRELSIHITLHTVYKKGLNLLYLTLSLHCELSYLLVVYLLDV